MDDQPAPEHRRPDGVTDAYPMSQAQIGMVVAAQNSGDRAYHIVTAVKVRDESALDGDALRAAVAELVAHHETLRTSFAPPVTARRCSSTTSS